MKFVAGAMMGEFSGSLGSTTASHNRFGSYLRLKVIPVNPNTTRQQGIRAVMATLVNLWANVLTGDQQIAWETWAENTPVDGTTMTGQNAYIRANSPRLQAGLNRADIAPIIFDLGVPISSYSQPTDSIPDVIGINNAETDMETSINVVGGASDIGNILLYLAAPINTSRGFFKGPYQLATVLSIPLDSVVETWVTAFGDLLSENGNPVVDQLRGLRGRITYNDGRLSALTDLLGVVTAATS